MHGPMRRSARLHMRREKEKENFFLLVMSDTDHEDAGAKRSGWILHAMRRVGLLMEQPEQCAWLLDDSSPVVSELRLHTRCAMYFRVKQDAENEPGTPSSESSNLS
mmetsp:Transcript_2752/g.7539  ORF Transcript_2752/g.7539 Transcript_2752/m.7539 type:complete len:106 (+) Transcript_2752:313-630(+)